MFFQINITFFFLFLLLFVSLIDGRGATTVDPTTVRKLDETPISGDPNEKCAPCTQNSPPPPSPSPPPPPPSPPPPDVVIYYSPPPPKKKEPKNNCPPPPPPSFMYIIGPPGDLYIIDQNYNGGRRIVAGLIGGGLLAVAVAGLLVI